MCKRPLAWKREEAVTDARILANALKTVMQITGVYAADPDKPDNPKKAGMYWIRSDIVQLMEKYGAKV